MITKFKWSSFFFSSPGRVVVILDKITKFSLLNTKFCGFFPFAEIFSQNILAATKRVNNS